MILKRFVQRLKREEYILSTTVFSHTQAATASTLTVREDIKLSARSTQRNPPITAGTILTTGRTATTHGGALILFRIQERTIPATTSI